MFYLAVVCVALVTVSAERVPCGRGRQVCAQRRQTSTVGGQVLCCGDDFNMQLSSYNNKTSCVCNRMITVTDCLEGRAQCQGASSVTAVGGLVKCCRQGHKMSSFHNSLVNGVVVNSCKCKSNTASSMANALPGLQQFFNNMDTSLNMLLPGFSNLGLIPTHRRQNQRRTHRRQGQTGGIFGFLPQFANPAYWMSQYRNNPAGMNALINKALAPQPTPVPKSQPEAIDSQKASVINNQTETKESEPKTVTQSKPLVQNFQPASVQNNRPPIQNYQNVAVQNYQPGPQNYQPVAVQNSHQAVQNYQQAIQNYQQASQNFQQSVVPNYQPAVVNPQSVANQYSQPAVFNVLAALRNSQPAVQNSLLAAVRDIKQAVQNSHSAAQNFMPKAQNSQPTVHNFLPAVQNSVQTVQNSQPTFHNFQPAVRNSLTAEQNSLPSVQNFKPQVKNFIAPSVQNNKPVGQESKPLCISTSGQIKMC